MYLHGKKQKKDDVPKQKETKSDVPKQKETKDELFTWEEAEDEVSTRGKIKDAMSAREETKDDAFTWEEAEDDAFARGNIMDAMSTREETKDDAFTWEETKDDSLLTWEETKDDGFSQEETKNDPSTDRSFLTVPPPPQPPIKKDNKLNNNSGGDGTPRDVLLNEIMKGAASSYMKQSQEEENGDNDGDRTSINDDDEPNKWEETKNDASMDRSFPVAPPPSPPVKKDSSQNSNEGKVSTPREILMDEILESDASSSTKQIQEEDDYDYEINIDDGSIAAKALSASEKLENILEELSPLPKDPKDDSNDMPTENVAASEEVEEMLERSSPLYSFDNGDETTQVFVETNGGPSNSYVEIQWSSNTEMSVSQQMYIFIDPECLEPFHCIVETPGRGNAIDIRSINPMDFPRDINVNFDVENGDVSSKLFYTRTPRIISGGGSYSFNLDPDVEGVQVLFSNDGYNPLSVRVEIEQGRSNTFQLVDIFTENGFVRPIFADFDTSGGGKTVTIRNKDTENALFAIVMPSRSWFLSTY